MGEDRAAKSGAPMVGWRWKGNGRESGKQSRWTSEGADSQGKDSKASKEERDEENQEEQSSQVYVKMADSKAIVLDVELSETVDGIKRKIRREWMRAGDDAYLTSKGQVLRGSDAVRKSTVDDGNTVHMMERLRGGGMHKHKRARVEQKRRET